MKPVKVDIIKGREPQFRSDEAGEWPEPDFYWSLREYCRQHARHIDATGLCPTCQREAKEQAETRANNEAVRRIAVEAEAEVLAEMWGLL